MRNQRCAELDPASDDESQCIAVSPADSVDLARFLGNSHRRHFYSSIYDKSCYRADPERLLCLVIHKALLAIRATISIEAGVL